MTGLGVISAIGADIGNLLFRRDLVQQLRQYQRIADAIASDFHGPDLQRGGLDA